MKRYLYILGSILIIPISLILLSKIGQNLPPIAEPILKSVQIQDRTDIKMATIVTGRLDTLEGFIFAGGSFLKIRKVTHNATVIIHPKGNLLIDTGLGKEIDQQFNEMPLVLKPLFGYEKTVPAAEVLNKNHISVSNIILTHMHWDHASGLKDFTSPTILTTKEEYEFSNREDAKPPAYMKSQYAGLTNFKFLNFDDGKYEIFEHSYDYYKDGSVVIVKLEGHSPGSVGIFVNLAKEKRYFFTGDLTWSEAGFLKSAHKFYISSLLVDMDRDLIGKEIGRLSEFLKNKPEIKVIPAHDYQAFQVLDKLE